MWSFVGSKRNKVWIWLAIDSLTKEIVGVYIGDRDQASLGTRSAIALQPENYGILYHQ